MTAFEYRDYKQFLREYVRSQRRKRPAFTLTRLASNLGIQPTYLSRVLNDEQSHFSEDQLFRVMSQIGLPTAEKEYVMMLRSLQVTGLEERKRAIERQLLALQRARDYADLPAIRRELEKIVEVLRNWEGSEETSGGAKELANRPQ